MEKKCYKCKNVKLAKEFSLNPSKKDGLNSLCKTCYKHYQKQWYFKNKDLHKKNVALSKKKQRSKISEILKKTKDVPCKDCGKKFPPECMDFDHLKDKRFTIGRKKGSVSMNRLIEEINKCDVVCANCHRIRTEARRNSKSQ